MMHKLNAIKPLTHQLMLLVCAAGASHCVEAPSSLQSGTASVKNATVARPAVSQLEQAAGDLDTLTGPGIVALSTEIAAELSLNLQASGLSLQQAEAIAGKAKQEARASVIAIDVVSGLGLSDGNSAKSPLQIVAPLIVKGATKALDDDDVSLPKEQRGGALENVVGSSFKSMNGRTSTLQSDDLSQLSGSVVAAAVSSLADAGMGEADAGTSSQAITRGAVSSLGSSGIAADNLGKVVSAVVAGTVAGFSTLNLSTEAIRSVASNATSGAVSSLDKTGLAADASVALIGQVAASSISALKSFNGSSLIISEVAGAVAASAVEALKDSTIITSGQLGEAVKSIAQGACDGLKDTGITASEIANGASAVAAGAVKGLTTTASADQLQGGELAEAALAGTFASMATTADFSDEAKVQFLATVVEKTVSNLANAGSDDTKSALLGAVVGATVQGMQTLGITGVTQVQSTVTSVTAAATGALVNANFAPTSFSDAVTVITGTTVNRLTASNATNLSLQELATVTASAVQGVANATETLKANNAITEETAKAAQTTAAVSAQETLLNSNAATNATQDQRDEIVQQTQDQLATVILPAIRYEPPRYSLPTHRSITIKPLVDTVPPTKCSITPELPTGLTLESDCSIKGMVNGIVALKSYSIIPENDKGKGGEQTLSFEIVLNNGSNAGNDIRPKIVYPQTEYNIVGQSTGNTTVQITPSYRGGNVDRCDKNHELPPGLTLSSKCVISGSIDFFGNNDFQPQNVIFLDANNNVINSSSLQSSATEGGEGSSGMNYLPPYPPSSIWHANEIKYKFTYEITPKNNLSGLGSPTSLVLVATPPPSIYPSREYNFSISGTSTYAHIEPTSIGLNFESCSITPALPTGSGTQLTIDNRTCKIFGSINNDLSPTVFAIKSKIAGQPERISRIKLSAKKIPYLMYFTNSYFDVFTGTTTPIQPSFSAGNSLPSNCALHKYPNVSWLTVSTSCQISAAPTAPGTAVQISLTPSGPAGTGSSVSLSVKPMKLINVSSTSTGSSIAISWSPVTNAAEYAVLASAHGNIQTNPPDGSAIQQYLVYNEFIVSTGTATTVVHSAPTPGNSYHYRVFAYTNSKLYLGRGDTGPLSIGTVVDTTAPVPPQITSVGNATNVGTSLTNPSRSTAANLNIVGYCEAGAKIYLFDTNISTCTATGTFSHTVSDTGNASMVFPFLQKDQAGNYSGSTAVYWIKDTVHPSPVAITSPSQNDYRSGDNALKIRGYCEPGATVTLELNIQNAPTVIASTVCLLDGTFTLTDSRNLSATYNYTLKQTDAAGNTSIPQTMKWTRDSSMLATPVLMSPSSDRYLSSSATLSISGTCGGQNQIELFGNVNAAEVMTPNQNPVLIQTCNNGTFSFTVTKENYGQYQLNIKQRAGTSSSAPAEIVWTYTNSALATPTIIHPPASSSNFSTHTSHDSLTIFGTCASGARVREISMLPPTEVICSRHGRFSMTKTASSDGERTLSIVQSISGSTLDSDPWTLSWTRDSSRLAPPLITIPTGAVLDAANGLQTIAGNCAPNTIVHLSGYSIPNSIIKIPNQSLSTPCSQGKFSFVLALSEDEHKLQVTQSMYNQASEPAFVWIKVDATAPIAGFSSVPLSPNTNIFSTHEFNSNEVDVQFECSLDGGNSFTVCKSPLKIQLPNGSQSLQVRARDAAGNLGNTQTDEWNQQAFKTIALYHFDQGSEFVDSSSSGISLFNSGTIQEVRNDTDYTQYFDGSSFLYATNVAILSNIRSAMTLELMVQLPAFVGADTTMGFLSQDSSAVNQPNNSFVFALVRSATPANNRLRFTFSTNGSNQISYESESVGDPSANNSPFHHAAVTFGDGMLTFFWDGNPKGSFAIGSATLYDSTANLLIGTTSNGDYFKGSIDEVRISQIRRWYGPFQGPPGRYTND